MPVGAGGSNRHSDHTEDRRTGCEDIRETLSLGVPVGDGSEENLEGLPEQLQGGVAGRRDGDQFWGQSVDRGADRVEGRAWGRVEDRGVADREDSEDHA